VISDLYRKQVELILRSLPHVFSEEVFALKGGSAINLFVRDIPRLSVDIDLCYVPVQEREVSLENISVSLESIGRLLEARIPGAMVIPTRVSGKITKLLVRLFDAVVTIETNTVIRGTVFPCETRELSSQVSERLGIEMFVEGNILSVADLYGGKICAALDRQHPRDLYDVKVLFDEEGITDPIRQAFIVYLASHDRPISESLMPHRANMRKAYEGEFAGMTLDPVTYEELETTRGELVSVLHRDLTAKEREFIVSLASGEPEWALMGLGGVEELPAVRWKLMNIRRMDEKKRQLEIEKLEEILSV
jgi:predicted nucleotidyltransferase component of viral defense system